MHDLVTGETCGDDALDAEELQVENLMGGDFVEPLERPLFFDGGGGEFVEQTWCLDGKPSG